LILHVFHARTINNEFFSKKEENKMSKKITLAMIAVIAVISVSGGCSRFNDGKAGPITPEDIAANLPEEQKAVFDKTNVDESNITKFVFKDFEGGCVYSLDEKTFLLTEDSEEQKVICYLDCATKVCCKPIAITETGNYLILETTSGETVAAKMKRSEMDKIVIPTETIAIDDLAEKEKNSLFKLIEEE